MGIDHIKERCWWVDIYLSLIKIHGGETCHTRAKMVTVLDEINHYQIFWGRLVGEIFVGYGIIF